MTYTQIWDLTTNAPSEAVVMRDRDGACIPFNEGNVDYLAYKEWLAEGHKPLSAEAPPKPPPARNLAAEIDDLRVEIERIKSKMTET
jgi:hypothetical protein